MTIPLQVDVFGFGHCCIDYLCILDPYPFKGKKGDVVESLIIGGGPVPTALQAIVQFGGTACFCGKAGADRDGYQITDELRDRGIDVSPMIIDPDVRTARAYIWIDKRDGSRTVALDLTRYSWLNADLLDDRLPQQCRVFLTDGRAAEATLKGLRLAREANVTTVLDVGTRRQRLDEMLPLVDYAVISQDLVDVFSKRNALELAHHFIESGVKIAIVTVGKEGAVWCDGISEGHVPGFKVKAIDTTGAGDVLHGAFIHGLLHGWSLERTIRFANATAALSCRKLSGSRGIPTLEETLSLYG